jgi:hypothetical protein
MTSLKEYCATLAHKVLGLPTFYYDDTLSYLVGFDQATRCAHPTFYAIWGAARSSPPFAASLLLYCLTLYIIASRRENYILANKSKAFTCRTKREERQKERKDGCRFGVMERILTAATKARSFLGTTLIQL